ncbi:hypothetical protein ABPG74_021400 [Tetrahymena malaccensis]
MNLFYKSSRNLVKSMIYGTSKGNIAKKKFSTPEEANTAKLAFNRKMLLNKDINIINYNYTQDFYLAPETSFQQSIKSTLQVNQLHENVTKEIILQEFEKFGAIKNLKLFTKKKSALVEFMTPEEANIAQIALNHKMLQTRRF